MKIQWLANRPIRFFYVCKNTNRSFLSICFFLCPTFALFIPKLAASENQIQPISSWQVEKNFLYSLSESPDEQTGLVYRFEWRKKDMDERRSTKGVELKSEPMPGLREQWAFFQFYIEDDHFIEDTKITIIMQYHSFPDFDLGEQWRNPISALVIDSGSIHYDFKASREPVTPGNPGAWVYSYRASIPLGAPIIREWNSMVFRQIFDWDGNAAIAIWFNGRKFERNNVSLGFNDKKGPYFKFGIYSPSGSDYESKVIYFRRVGLLDASPGDEEEVINRIKNHFGQN